MRLLSITNRYYIIISLALMIMGNAFLAYRMLYLFDRQTSDEIRLERQMIDDQLFKEKNIQHQPITLGDEIEITPISKVSMLFMQPQAKDTTLFDQYSKMPARYRTFIYEEQIDTAFYRISLKKRLAETKDIYSGILITLLIIGLDVVASFFLLSWWISNNIWTPFYRALRVLKNFDLRKREKVALKTSRVDEFNMMNEELTKLMEKVSSDYSNLKEFTENMSHETQTPLAIIHSKLDLLLQSDLTRHQQEEVKITLDAVNRLAKMNKALVLLAKIDNSQFEEQQFNIGKIIKKHLAAFEPFIQGKNLRLVTDIHDDIFVEMNPNLADMLLSNLFSNAIRYNKENGLLRISFANNKLLVENTGDPIDVPPEQIFERVSVRYKHDSVGLGLAIVKRICDASRANIQYAYRDNLHAFTVEFDSKKVFHEEPIIS